MHVTRDEFERLAMEQVDMIDRISRTLTRDSAEAEDLVQETFLRAIRAWDRFDLRPHGIRPWLVRILHNVHATRASRAARQPAYLDEETLETAGPRSENGELERWESREALQAALQQIQPELRTALELWAVEGFSYQEMADALTIPIGTVMSRLHRAKHQLRAKYDRLSGTVPKNAE